MNLKRSALFIAVWASLLSMNGAMADQPSTIKLPELSDAEQTTYMEVMPRFASEPTIQLVLLKDYAVAQNHSATGTLYHSQKMGFTYHCVKQTATLTSVIGYRERKGLGLEVYSENKAAEPFNINDMIPAYAAIVINERCQS